MSCSHVCSLISSSIKCEVMSRLTEFHLRSIPILFVLSCTLILLATGCASTGKSSVSQPLNVKLSGFKSATVEIKSALPKSPAKLDEFMVQLESRVIAKLRERRAFDKIYPQAATDSPSELRILVSITKVREVNSFDRVMWGAFAGQAATEATLEVREQATGKLLGAGEIKGKSSGGSVIAGTTSEAVDRVADEVVRFVVENL